jgi:sulfite exporter TauE/SafE
MTMLEQISNPYIASLALGLLYGLTFCTSVCLPYLASYIAGIKAGFYRGLKVTAVYNTGRITAYAIMGTLVGVFQTYINDIIFRTYQGYSSIIFGFVVILIGISILFRKTPGKTCTANCPAPKKMLSNLRQKFDIRAFFMGFTRGFVLCPPLVALLLYSVTLSQVNCTALAVLFGLGTALSPLLFLGGAVGWLLEKALLFRKWTSILGGAILILLGVFVLQVSIIEFL